MRSFISILLGLLILQTMCLSENNAGVCVIPLSQQNNFPLIIPLSNTNLVVIYVDFADGRVPSTGQPPNTIAELNQVENVNAVGSLGWVRDGYGQPRYLKIRKYSYEDYWDQFFSDNTWVGQSRNPDYDSHKDFVNNIDPNNPINYNDFLTLHGSVKEYWKEVSYGNHIIQAYPTRNGVQDKYNTGIVNNYDIINGKNIFIGYNYPVKGRTTAVIHRPQAH